MGHFHEPGKGGGINEVLKPGVRAFEGERNSRVSLWGGGTETVGELDQSRSRAWRVLRRDLQEQAWWDLLRKWRQKSNS